MIVKRYWRKYKKDMSHTAWKGWFLFGFIPLYVEQVLY